MAQTDRYVLAGPCTVSLADWVTNAGSGSYTEVGHTETNTEITPEQELYEPESEQSRGPVRSDFTKYGFTLKIPAMESNADLVAKLLSQATGQVSGTGDNKTLAVADPANNYYQVKIVGVGPGTTGVRTWTLWRCKPISVEPIPIGRSAIQRYNTTFRVYRDSSITTPTTNGYFFKQVDA